MKHKIIMSALALIVMIMAPFYVSASNLLEETEASEAYASQAPWKYGEIENGLFVRETLWAEVSWISKEDTRFFLEYDLALQARKLEELTPEMIAAGYQLIHGIAYSPAEAEGDVSDEATARERQQQELENLTKITYDEDGNVVVPYGYGYVTLAATTEHGIHQTCFVEVTNVNSSKRYSFPLFEQNSYNTNVQLPEGSYLITDGGIPDDYTSAYPIENKSFQVSAGEAVIVAFTIGNINADELKDGVVIEAPNSLTFIQDTETEAENSAAGKKQIRDIIMRTVIVLLIVLTVLIIKTKKKQYTENQKEKQ